MHLRISNRTMISKILALLLHAFLVDRGHAEAEDIYNPDAYQSANSLNETGTYILINRGEQSWKSNEHTAQEWEWRFSTRFVVLLEKRDAGEPYLISVCDGRDWGRLSSQGVQFEQNAGDNSRFSATYEKHVPEFSEVMTKSRRNNPLNIFPYYSTIDTPKESIKQLRVSGRFDLIRIAPMKSEVGRSKLSYTLGRETFNSDNACFYQTQKDLTVVFPFMERRPNRFQTLHDALVAVNVDWDQSLQLDMMSGDLIWPGLDPNKANKAGFSMRLETPQEKSIYMDMFLDKRGETGRVRQNINANDINRLEVSGNAIPDGSKLFEEGSLPAAYHLVLPLK